MDLIVITLKSWVELSVLGLPFVIVPQHIQEQVLVHWIVDCFSTDKLSPEHIFTNGCLLKVSCKKGVHIKY